jgi:hypothetical protein
MEEELKKSDKFLKWEIPLLLINREQSKMLDFF